MENIVITGSTRGLGFAMATEFLRAGCNVTLSGRGEMLAEAAQRELSPFEGKYIHVSCNVQEKENLQKLWDTSLAQWGEIDIWINNAGKIRRTCFRGKRAKRTPKILSRQILLV